MVSYLTNLETITALAHLVQALYIPKHTPASDNHTLNCECSLTTKSCIDPLEFRGSRIRYSDSDDVDASTVVIRQH